MMSNPEVYKSIEANGEKKLRPVLLSKSQFEASKLRVRLLNESRDAVNSSSDRMVPVQTVDKSHQEPKETDADIAARQEDIADSLTTVSAAIDSTIDTAQVSESDKAAATQSAYQEVVEASAETNEQQISPIDHQPTAIQQGVVFERHHPDHSSLAADGQPEFASDQATTSLQTGKYPQPQKRAEYQTAYVQPAAPNQYTAVQQFAAPGAVIAPTQPVETQDRRVEEVRRLMDEYYAAQRLVGVAPDSQNLYGGRE